MIQVDIINEDGLNGEKNLLSSKLNIHGLCSVHVHIFHTSHLPRIVNGRMTLIL